jgi:hypothetical protein
MRRAVLLLVALVALVGSTLPAIPAHAGVDLDPYRGLGSWVDVFDYAERAQPEGSPPPVTPESVDDMASLGARTLYLQVVNPVGDPPTSLFDAALLDDFVAHAHDSGMQVVAWYLPSVADVKADYAMMQRIASFRVDGRGFDGIALDLEDTTAVPEVSVRNDRIVDLTKRTRKLLGKSRALGAIVYPAVQTELINPGLWPTFPYRRLQPSIDVWLPMAYFTFRNAEYRDPLRYTEDSVAMLRAHLRDRSATVHVVGGIADQTTAEDYASFLLAARRTRAVGYSVYDFRTTSSAAWAALREG